MATSTELAEDSFWVILGREERMRPRAYESQTLRLESADVWAKAEELRRRAERICASAAYQRIRAALVRAQVEGARIRRRHERLEGSLRA